MYNYNGNTYLITTFSYTCMCQYDKCMYKVI